MSNAPIFFHHSIQHIGRLAGICKIVPPKKWRPPFGINENTFRFRTRVQQLNCLEGSTRVEGNFVESLRMFLYRQGSPMKTLPKINGKVVPLYRLYKCVQENGGYYQVCKSNTWPEVVAQVEMCEEVKLCVDVCRQYHDMYKSNLLPYELSKSSTQKPDNFLCAQSSKDKDTTGNPCLYHDIEKKKVLGGETIIEEGVFLTNDSAHTSSQQGDVEKSDGESGSIISAASRQTKLSSHEGPLTLEPAGLSPDGARECFSEPPDIRVGQKFFQYFSTDSTKRSCAQTQSIDADKDAHMYLAEVKRVVLSGKKPFGIVEYANNGKRQTIDYSSLQILIANGWSLEAAKLAYENRICQRCLRSDSRGRMLVCNGCNTEYHSFCLQLPNKVDGDWYCDVCVAETIADEKDENKTKMNFGFEKGREYNVTEFREKANAWQATYFKDRNILPHQMNDAYLEQEYWKILRSPVYEQCIEIEYGSDVDSGVNGSGFPSVHILSKNIRLATKRLEQIRKLKRNCPGYFVSSVEQEKVDSKVSYHTQAIGWDKENLDTLFLHGLPHDLPDRKASEQLRSDIQRYAEDAWNLNNLPKLKGSLLRHVDQDIKGVMVPWIYMGMMFSTFCWHIEDHNFYSMSYLHCGAPKIWYGVPCDQGSIFEAIMKQLTPELFGSQPDLHMQLVTMFSPDTLKRRGLSVYRATHCEGEFMVTFPGGYHAGFNQGFNCSEAVNFATIDWLPWGMDSLAKYQIYRKLPVFAHEALLCSLAENALAERDEIDFIGVRQYLLPALKELYSQFICFEKAIQSDRILMSETMDFYEETQGNILARVGNDDGVLIKKSESVFEELRYGLRKRFSVKLSSDSSAHRDKRRKSQNKMSGPVLSETASGRPMRMMSWTGQSEKSQGVRCIICKQYCYLQAVLCSQCRPETIACIDHYKAMCNCDSAHYLRLFRFSGDQLISIIQSLESRVQNITEWSSRAESALGIKNESIKSIGKSHLVDAKRFSAEELVELYNEGRQLQGVPKSLFKELQKAHADVVVWSADVQDTLMNQRNKSYPSSDELDKMMTQLIELQTRAKQLLAAPEELYMQLKTRVKDLRRLKYELEEFNRSVTSLQQEQMKPLDISKKDVHADLAGAFARIKILDARRHQLHQQAHLLGLFTSSMTIFARSNDYVELMLEVHSILLKIQQMADYRGNRGQLGEQREAKTIDHKLRAKQSCCRNVLNRVNAHSEKFGLYNDSQMPKIHLLESLLTTSENLAAEVEATLSDHTKSLEELERLCERCERCLISPRNVVNLGDRLQMVKQWHTEARKILQSTKLPIADRYNFDELKALYDRADTCFVSSSSLLHRQLHSRIQDCRRWEANLYTLFCRGSCKQTNCLEEHERKVLLKFLDRAAQKLKNFDGRNLSPLFKTHCVCDQVLCSQTKMIACSRCDLLFHRECVGLDSPLQEASTGGFWTCTTCASKVHQEDFKSVGCQAIPTEPEGDQEVLHTRGSIEMSESANRYCICRQSHDDVPMICCDFCDEWYHLQCLGFKLKESENMKAYRCQRCTVRQNIMPFDTKKLKRSAVGKFPTIQRVHSLLRQLEQTLVAVPESARYLIQYNHSIGQVEARMRAFLNNFWSNTILDVREAENITIEMIKIFTVLEVDLTETRVRFHALHWYLRGIRLAQCKSHALPKYTHLVIFLADTKELHSTKKEQLRTLFDVISMQVERAERWIQRNKMMDVLSNDTVQLKELNREREELSLLMELPEAQNDT
uniref:Histone demethylase putative n=1 Tax=Albugo laibachii Nc14 TaxID=890382 RepID=F0W4W0_9STRA|nr:histone demethylase putative [Albugo laibachii Nc14]|eukprot:CCA16149.1 histone demethylase putative [Albugo laibachii Nc14]